LPRILILKNVGNPLSDLNIHLPEISDWKINCIATNFKIAEKLQKYFEDNEVHFLLYTKGLTQSAFIELKVLRQKFPFLPILYYHSQLRNREFAFLYNLGINLCVIGEYKEFYVIEALKKLWDQHWKKVPEDILGKDRMLLSHRAKRIIELIENKPLSKFNISDMAKNLEISESHFRSEFKEALGISFREFKQRLLKHYETKLLFEKGFKPNIVCEILDYKNLSGFSRSFKKRHGKSWREVVQEYRENSA